MPINPEDLRVGLVGELTGGVGIYGQHLLRGLALVGVVPVVLTPDPEQAPSGGAVRVPKVAGRGRWLPQALAFARALRAAGGPFDIVHFTDARYALFVPAGRPPLVATMNDYFYAITGWFSPRGTRSVYRDWRLRHLYYNLLRTAESFTLPRCQRILCLSTAVQDALRRRYGIPADRLPVVPYGISEGPADSRPLPKAGPTILFAGGNFQRKGLAVLMLASPRILQAIPAARFIILGDSRDDRLIRRLCRHAGVAEAFQFLGAVDYPTLYRYYRTADVFVMPSLLEAFGLPYLEAMQCGLPVVASDVPGPSDFLVNEVNALTPAAGDAAQLAAAVLRALTDDSLRRRLIRNGRTTVDQFTVRRMAEQTLAVYQAVCQAGATAGEKTVR